MKNGLKGISIILVASPNSSASSARTHAPCAKSTKYDDTNQPD